LLILRAPEAFVKTGCLDFTREALLQLAHQRHRGFLIGLPRLHYVSREDKASAILYDQYPVTKLDRIRHFAC